MAMRPRMPGIFSLLVQSREEAIFYLQDITGTSKSLWFREGKDCFSSRARTRRGEMKMLCSWCSPINIKELKKK